MINPKTAMFGAISIFHQRLYSVKTVTSLSVFCGCFSGAIPFMLIGCLLQQAILG
jgi:heme O synthase-like polyprenyltransferase